MSEVAPPELPTEPGSTGGAPPEVIVEHVRRHLAAAHDADAAEASDRTVADLARTRLGDLRGLFALDAFETDVVAATFAVAVDPAIGPLFGALSGDPGRAWPTELLVERVFLHEPGWRLSSESALRAFAIVREAHTGPGEPAALILDPQIRDFLLGRDELPASLVEIGRAIDPAPALEGWPVDETVERIRRAIEVGQPGRVRVIVRGAPRSGRRTFAAAVAERLGLRAIALDADAVSDAEHAAVWADVQRHAFLTGCAPVWHGPLAALRGPTASVAPFPVQMICVDDRAPVRRCDGVVDLEAELGLPTMRERAALWRALAPSMLAEEPELDALAATFRVHVGEIADVGATGVRNTAEAAERVRSQTRHGITDLAQRLECPFDWQDLVVPDTTREALADLAFEARDRAVFWERPEARRLFPQGRGLITLFTGPPGTGKTMAAQVIAADLGVDLYRIDLSAVISKWVGETAKNLERVLARAARMDIVLLFDEADALFAKRVTVQDAQDRHANADTDHLLQAIEGYTGVAVLASNRRSQLDPAFTRRIRWVLEFPPPTADERLRIWRGVVSALLPAADVRELDGALEAIARGLELTGAQIKSALLHATFAARREATPLARRHLLRGIERELLKEGRALTPRDRARLGDAS